MSEQVFCEGSLGFPLFGETEQSWPRGLRATLYILGLIWCFLGVAIISDVFMSAIEAITSKKKHTLDKSTGKYITVAVWNDTVANLTLMALGSSAPEILLSVIELLSMEFFSGELGPSTIVGSAAFNLFVIIAVCISSIPDGEVRKIKDVSVFVVTASFSIFAYSWVLFILSVSSEDIVEPWEGLLTLFFFPILVVLAFAADKGMFSSESGAKKLVQSNVSASDMTKEELALMVAHIRKDCTQDLSDEKILNIIEKQAGCHHSRAAYRVNATRAITGGRRVSVTGDHNMLPKDGVTHCQDTFDERVNHQSSQSRAAVIEWSEHRHAVLESAGQVMLSIRRSGDLQRTVKVHYKTRDGKAKAGEDYKQCNDEVIFMPDEIRKDIKIEIIDDDIVEEDEDFYVDLCSPSCIGGGSAMLGDCTTTEIWIIDDDEPGTLFFAESTLRVCEDVAKDKVIQVEVFRRHGCSGTVTCKYYTENDSAVSPVDYIGVSGELVLQNGQSSACIDITIKAVGRYERAELFRLILEDATGGAKFDGETDGGHHSNICTIYIEAANEAKDMVDSLNRNLKLNWDKAQIGTSNWSEQFSSALWCNGSREEHQEASNIELCLHFAALPWKLIFACVPPTDFVGGWLCFWTALIFIGGVTAIIGELATLVGCSLGVPDAVTAITFVALGTSLPDTFASKTAAIQDPFADASVGNVTGSNSVNVFLGLGLPWSTGAIYWRYVDSSEEWARRYPDVVGRVDDGLWFVVKAGSLGFSVSVFTGCALCCLCMLMVRRQRCGGELGGTRAWKIGSSGFLVLLWFVYISLASWRFISEMNDSQ